MTARCLWGFWTCLLYTSSGGWFRDYVYIPLGGNRVSRGKWVRNILIVWMLTGLWHGAAWNFVLWGLVFAGLLLLEKWVPGLQKLPDPIRQTYVLLAVCLSFVLFNAQSLSQAAGDFAALFGFGGLPVFTAETGYYLGSFLPLLLISLLGATPVVKNYGRYLEKNGFIRTIQPLFWIGLALVATGYLVDGSFSPFLYFRF